MPNCVVFYGNSLMPRPCIISRPIRLATSPELKAKSLYTKDIQRLYRVISSIVNFRPNKMDLSTYIGQIFVLKEEFLSLMLDSTEVETRHLKASRVFMIHT